MSEAMYERLQTEGDLLAEALAALKQAPAAINAAHQQTDAEWRDHMKAADRHDKTVRAFREQARAILAKAGNPGEAGNG